jgi:hypothetical protein
MKIGKYVNTNPKYQELNEFFGFRIQGLVRV